MLVNTVTPSDRRGALEIQLCAVVVGKLDLRYGVGRRVKNVCAIKDRKLGRVWVARIQADVDAGVADPAIVESCSSEVLAADIVGAGN